MMVLAMPLDVFAALLLFAFVSSITPGPNNLMLMASGVNFGFRRTVPHMLGIGAGFFSLLIGVGIGLGAVLLAYPGLHVALKLCGGAFRIMLERMSLTGVAAAACLLLVPLFAVGWLTREDPAETPYLQILGGGFIFNYRVADVYYGFTAIVRRPLPTGTVVEATFEDPAGGPAHVVRQRLGGAEMTRLSLRSPPVRGVEARKPYHVALRIPDREEERLIWSQGIDVRSRIGDEVVPEQPLTIGPGYARNPATGGLRTGEGGR